MDNIEDANGKTAFQILIYIGTEEIDLIGIPSMFLISIGYKFQIIDMNS